MTFGSGVAIDSTTFVGPGEIDVVISISPATKPGARTVTVTNKDHGKGKVAKAFAVT